MRRSRTVLIGSAAAAVLLVGGCAGTSHTASSSGASKHIELTRANFASTLTSTQKERGTFHTAMTMTASGQNIAMTGDFNTKGTQLLASMRMTMSSASYTVRMIGSTMYMSQNGNTWFKLDLAKTGNSSLSQLTKVADNLDLTQQIANLGKNASSFTKLGSGGTIDGVTTTKYRVVVDTEKVLASEGVKASDLSGSAKLPKSFTYDLYVGSDGLPRRLTTSTVTPFTMNISKWGQPVSVSAPPADKVTDLTSKYSSSASSSS